MKKAPALLLAFGLLGGLLAGCSNGSQKESSTSANREPINENLVLGTKNSSSKKVSLTNKTGETIDSITLSLQPSGSDSQAKNLIPDGESWKPGARADLYLTEEEQLSNSLQMSVQLRNGSQTRTLSINNVPASSLGATAELNIQDDQLYLSWLQDGKVVSTLDGPAASSSQTSEENQDSAPVDESEDPSAQQPSEPVYIEPVYEEPTYEEPAYQEPVYEEPVDEDLYYDDYQADDGTQDVYEDQTGVDEYGYSTDEIVLNPER